MENKTRMNHALPIFCVLLLMITAILPVAPLSGEEKIYENTIRLHVIANSDSEEDQSLKLKVRDAVLDYVSGFLSSEETKEESSSKLEIRMNNIKTIAANTVNKLGYDYEVNVSLDKEYYPSCEYEGVKLPEGRYTSLRVKIGNAEGHNWWCVLYPTLCTSASKPEKELQSAGFTKEEIRVLTDSENPKYVIKFKLLETASSIWKLITG